MAGVGNATDTTPCPHCGTVLRRGMIRCRECGGVVGDDFELSADVRALAATRHCNQCGSELEPGVAHCPNCASAMLDELLSKPVPEERLPDLPEIFHERDTPAPSASVNDRRLRPSNAAPARSENFDKETEDEAPEAASRQTRARQSGQTGGQGGKRRRPGPSGRPSPRSRRRDDDDAFDYLSDDSGVEEPGSGVESAPVRGKPEADASSSRSSSSTPSEGATASPSASDTSGACGVLITSLALPDVDLRCQAATALGALGNKEALAPLERLLTDGEIKVRRAAAEALIQLGHPKGESLRGIAQRPPVDGPAAAKTDRSPPKRARVKGDFGLSLAGSGKLLKGAALVVVLVGGFMLIKGMLGGGDGAAKTVPIVGNVKTSGGAPVSGVRLILTADNGNVLSTFGFDLDQEGHFAGQAIPGAYKFYFGPVGVQRDEDDGRPVNQTEAKKLKDSTETLTKLIPPAYHSPSKANPKVQVTSGADVNLVLSK